MFAPAGSASDSFARIIQEALTPIFLLSGIAALLNVFSARLARVADQVAALVVGALGAAAAAEGEVRAHQLRNLRRRLVALDAAVVLAAIGGAATCGTVLVLFIGTLRDSTTSTLLFGLFGTAVASTLGAILLFTVEMLMAGTGIGAALARGRRVALKDEPAEVPEGHPHEDIAADAADS
ncbi:MAG: DUF2721 domain-containing protein [Stellaceae bacterium]